MRFCGSALITEIWVRGAFRRVPRHAARGGYIAHSLDWSCHYPFDVSMTFMQLKEMKYLATRETAVFKSLEAFSVSAVKQTSTGFRDARNPAAAVVFKPLTGMIVSLG